MTKLLEQAIEAVRELTAEEQDEIARAMLLLAGSGDGGDVYVLSPEERAAIGRSIDFADRGAFASDEEVSAVFAKYAR